MLHFKVQHQQRSALYTADGIWDLTHWTETKNHSFSKGSLFSQRRQQPHLSWERYPWVDAVLKVGGVAQKAQRILEWRACNSQCLAPDTVKQVTRLLPNYFF